MRKISSIILLLILVLFFSCEEHGFLVDCPDCTPDEPVVADLEAKIEPSYYADALIQIWEGNIEDSVLYGSYNAYSTDFIQEVTINKKYTITATYYIANNTYIAVDSATPRVRYDKSQCEEPCYFVYDRICDLRLKYTK